MSDMMSVNVFLLECRVYRKSTYLSVEVLSCGDL
jgi:hypothetical protein